MTINALRTISRYRPVLSYLAVILIIALPLFGHLDELPVQVWDEMRNGQNALEMNRTGQLIVTTYDYLPETWNTKPPLLIWILALSYKVLGNNELALRLPSAIAAALTCLLLLRFARRRTGQWMPGIIAVLILVTIPGFVVPHGTRTGDYDALLVLCTTAALFWCCNYVEEGRARWLYFAAAALTAAVLTKGVAGFFSCPAILGYVILRGKAKALLREKALYRGAAGFLLVIGGYYGLRELQQPGYLHAVAINELGGRFNAVIPGIQPSGPWAYFDELANVAFTPWMLLVLPAVLAAIATRRRDWRRLSLLCGLLVTTLLLILSCASTRLWWYMMPIYPGLALLCGMFVAQALALLGRWPQARGIWRAPFLPVAALILLAAGPYRNILERTIGDGYRIWDRDKHDVGMYLKEVIRHDRPLAGSVLCGIDAFHFRWYQEVVRQQGGRLDAIGVDSLSAGMNVLSWDGGVKDEIRRKYRCAEVETFRALTVFRIDGPATDSTGAACPD